MLVLTLTSLVVRVRPSTVSRQEILRMTTGGGGAGRRFGRNFKLKNTLQICPSSVTSCVWRAESKARNNAMAQKTAQQDPPRRRRSVVYLESQ